MFGHLVLVLLLQVGKLCPVRPQHVRKWKVVLPSLLVRQDVLAQQLVKSHPLEHRLHVQRLDELLLHVLGPAFPGDLVQVGNDYVSLDGRRRLLRLLHIHVETKKGE